MQGSLGTKSGGNELKTLIGEKEEWRALKGNGLLLAPPI